MSAQEIPNAAALVRARGEMKIRSDEDCVTAGDAAGGNATLALPASATATLPATIESIGSSRPPITAISVLIGLLFNIRLIGHHLEKKLALSHRIALVLKPLGDRPLFHTLPKRGHHDCFGHFPTVPL
jgi:hypothetical protein